MELRLATFNLENLGIRPEDDSPAARERLPHHLEALRGALRRLDADAVAVQEVLEPSLLNDLVDTLGYRYVVLGDRASSPLLLGVVSRYPLKAAAAVAGAADFSLIEEKTGLEVTVRGAFSRPALRVTWDVPGFETDLFVVHWKSKIPTHVPGGAAEGKRTWISHGHAGEGRLVTEVKRLAQAVELRKALDRSLQGEGTGRLAVLGDFNDTLDSECLRIVRGDSRGCETPALAPWELVPCELSVPEDRRFSQLYRGRREMLDHVLVSRDLLPHLDSVRILNEDLAEASEGPVIDPYSAASDHAPVLVTFRV